MDLWYLRTIFFLIDDDHEKWPSEPDKHGDKQDKQLIIYYTILSNY